MNDGIDTDRRSPGIRAAKLQNTRASDIDGMIRGRKGYISRVHMDRGILDDGMGVGHHGIDDERPADGRAVFFEGALSAKGDAGGNGIVQGDKRDTVSLIFLMIDKNVFQIAPNIVYDNVH